MPCGENQDKNVERDLQKIISQQRERTGWESLQFITMTWWGDRLTGIMRQIPLSRWNR